MDEAQTRAGLAHEFPLDELMQQWRDLVERWRVLGEKCRGSMSTKTDFQLVDEAWARAEVAWSRYEATKAMRERVMGVEPILPKG